MKISANNMRYSVLKTKFKSMVGVFLGTIFQYYDYSIYAFSAGFLSKHFFSNTDQTDGLIDVFAIYAVGYISKPIGALIFGYIGDSFGRKKALNITMLGMSIPTMIIGILPSYNVMGDLCVVIILICRFLQSVFVAGEYDGAAIYIIEHLGKNRKYTASALTRSAGAVGLIIGIGVTTLFSWDIFPEFFWRMPFLFSFPFALLVVKYRKDIIETNDFHKHKQEKAKSNTFFVIRNNFPTIFMIVLLSGGFGVTYQISTIFMKQYLPIVMPETKSIINLFSVILIVFFTISMTLSGFLSDAYGVIKVMKFSVIFSIASVILLILSIIYEKKYLCLFSSLLLAVSVAPFNAIAHGVIVKLFNINERYRSISIGHTIGSMLMSGSAVYACLSFMKKYEFNLFPLIYVSFFCFLSFFVVFFLEKSSFKDKT